MQNAFIIPPDKLSQVALNSLIDEFILREGTDYGIKEFTLEEKKSQILKQLKNNKIYIVYDANEESTSILRKEQIPISLLATE